MIYYLWRYWQGITISESVELRHSPLASQNLTINQPDFWKRCKIGGKLVLITNVQFISPVGRTTEYKNKQTKAKLK